jgi:hypothetical protein
MAEIANISSEQNLQVGVNGPGDVASMHVVSGIANGTLSAFAQSGGFVQQQATFAAHVGPSLTAAQFRKAIASAAITSLSLSGEGSFIRWEVTDVDADFDDDAGRIKLTFDLRVSVSAGVTGLSAVVASVGFQVLILTT